MNAQTFKSMLTSEIKAYQDKPSKEKESVKTNHVNVLEEKMRWNLMSK